MRKLLLVFAVVGLAASLAGASSIDSTVAGFPVNPSVTNVTLDQGDLFCVPIWVTVPEGGATKLDVFLLEDLSGSFSDDINTLKTTGGNLAGSVFDGVRAAVTDSLFGVGSFVDKPTWPKTSYTYGYEDAGDYVYMTNLSLTGTKGTFTGAIDILTTYSGGDGPEAQLEALMQAALRGGEIGWRGDALKVVVLSTDANYHVAGDYPDFGPNDGDAILDALTGTPGLGEDYPGIAQVKAILEANGIIPIFAVTSGQIGTYSSLVTALGRGTVVTLSSDSSNLVSAILAGLEDVLYNVSLVTVSDPYGYVHSIVPPSFTDVMPGDTVEFCVNLYSAGPVMPTSIVLAAPGYGRSIININGIPEPSTFALLGLGVLGFGVAAYRRRNRK